MAVYADKEAVDATTPHGRAMLQMAAVFAELERGMIRERVIAGLARVRAEGKKKLGRPKVGSTKEAAIRAHLTAGKGMLKVATVQRVKAEKTVAQLAWHTSSNGLGTSEIADAEVKQPALCGFFSSLSENQSAIVARSQAVIVPPQDPMSNAARVDEQIGSGDHRCPVRHCQLTSTGVVRLAADD